MRNQVETQKERSQGTSIQQNSVHYLPLGGVGGSEINRFQNNLLQNPILSRSVGPLECAMK